MNVEGLIKEQAVRLKSTGREIDIAPDIPPQQMEKWLSKYHQDSGLGSYILVLSYTGTGNFALTGDTMYYDNFLQGGLSSIKYKDIQSVRCEYGKRFSPDKVIVQTKAGRQITLDGCIDGIRVQLFADTLNHIATTAKAEDLTVSKQDVALCDVPEKVKELYLKILYNYAYLNDQAIDGEEYNAISEFSIRMETDDETRTALRAYTSSIHTRVKTGYLLRDLRREIGREQGQWDAVRYSLLQDALFIHKIQDKQQPWREDGFIGSLMKACGLRPAQLDTMVQAVELNRKMQEKNADLKTLRTKWDRLTKSVKNTESYVPTRYLFCSGSVYGIESYSGFLQSSDTSQKALNKQRELILHDIIINNQKVVNVLVMDMNALADDLEKAMKEGKDSKDTINKLLRKIRASKKRLEVYKKLTKELTEQQRAQHLNDDDNTRVSGAAPHQLSEE